MKVLALLLLLAAALVAVTSATSVAVIPFPVQSEEPECTGDPEGNRWRKDCNWCSCRNGREACSRRLCVEGQEDEEPECEGTPTWKDDCNTCSCVNGRAVCTSMHCEGPLGPETVVTVERRALQCEEGSRWRVACNWCVCMEGRSSCTEAACNDWSEAKAVEEGIVECHGESRWKKDCNWCSCVNGRGVCTLLACLPPERNPFHNLPDNAVCVPGSRWKEECNWCNCGENGLAACTLKACLPGFQQEGPTCTEGSVWRNDCNICRCINGVSVCPTRPCRPQETSDSTSPQLPPEPQCQGEEEGDRWRQDCNWCRCRNGVGACTKRLCPEGQTDEGPECEGNVSWMKDCNRCNCVNGTAVCTSAFCGPLPTRPIPRRGGATREPECQSEGEGGRWRQDCNWCRCRNGVGACTKRLCPEGQEDEGPECEGNVSWKKDCNRCRCVNGTAVCTSAFCGPLPARPVPRRGGATRVPECQGEEEGDRWRQDCNWCRCRNGVGACTKRLCPEGQEYEGPECEGNVSWKKDCNRCRCINGTAVCTSAFCGPLPARPVPRRGGATRVPECQGEEEEDRWRQDCNWCRCRNGVGACTKRLCREGEGDEGPECEGNVSWKKDCNRCHCVNGTAVCTSAFCGPLPPRLAPHREVQEPQCQGDPEKDRWIHNCNWCRCIDGGAACTKRLCRPGEKSLPLCEGNPSWKKDCNRCYCNNGTAVCTSMHCGGPLGPQRTLSVQVTQAKERKPECVDGSRWHVDCNWCSCHDGVAACTEKACLGQHAGQGEPECEGDSTWKNDCNWCTCGQGLALCTRMACRRETEGVCIEGTSWRENCNICRCSQGFVLCTKMACAKHGKGLECQGDSCSPRELPELCSLPPVSGPLQCTGFFMKWSFSSTDGECQQIVYGGCGATANVFDSRAECETACPAPAPTTTQTRRILPVDRAASSGGERCTLPKVQGPCFAAFHRYAYNPVTGACEEFLFGGCGGNANNFVTEDECVAACQGTQVTACDKSKCPWNLWGHYLAKECVPQYTGDVCCPTSFQCPSASESGKDPAKCHYNGVAYNIGDSVPVEEPCSASCHCSPSTLPNGPPEVQCANVECPELFRPPTPGCRPLYRADRCCAYDYDCVDPDAPPLEPRAATCVWQNKTYLDGDKMYLDDHPCRFCICGPGFTDPNGPGCFNIDCGLTFRYTSQYHQGCSPIHFEGRRCCPIGWMCPDDSRIEPQQQQQQQPGTADESAVCRLGDRLFAVGEKLGLTDCKVECRCVTPPELTCIQYRSCEVAQEATAQKECPLPKCRAGCRLLARVPGECPTCSCSPDTFTCPAQTCPSNCRPEVDLQTGCPSCKCQCPSEVPCPMDCPVHTVLDEATGCPRCECQPGSPQARSLCPEYPGGQVPCPQDCAVITRVDENGCERCECDPADTGHPFGPPPPPQNPATCRTLPDGRAPCPMDCAIIRFTDENGCEVCQCDPNNPGHPFGPFGPPPPPQPRDGRICAGSGKAPCPMDCAVIRSMDENGCEVCRCDPNNPGNPFGPFRPPPPHQHRVRRSCPGSGEAPCPQDCAVIRYTDENGCEVCKCDPDNPGNPFGPFLPPPRYSLYP